MGQQSASAALQWGWIAGGAVPDGWGKIIFQRKAAKNAELRKGMESIISSEILEIKVQPSNYTVDIIENPTGKTFTTFVIKITSENLENIFLNTHLAKINCNILKIHHSNVSQQLT